MHKIILPLMGVAVVSAAGCYVGWHAADTSAEFRNEPLVLTAKEQVKRKLKNAAAKFCSLQYFEQTRAACGQVGWEAASSRPAGKTFFVADPSGSVQLARDMPVGDFMNLVKEKCPQQAVVSAAAEMVMGSQRVARHATAR